jgi:hypothetical protein
MKDALSQHISNEKLYFSSKVILNDIQEIGF